MKITQDVEARLKQKKTIVNMLNRINHKNKMIAITEKQYDKFLDKMIYCDSVKNSVIKREELGFYARNYRDRPRECRRNKAQLLAQKYNFNQAKIPIVKTVFIEKRKKVKKKSFKEIKRELAKSLNYY